MGGLVEEYQDEFHEMRLYCEEHFGVALSDLEFITENALLHRQMFCPDNPLDAVFGWILVSLRIARGDYDQSPLGYCPRSPHAVFLDEQHYPESDFSKIPLPYGLGHELAHAVHYHLSEKAYRKAEQMELPLRTAVLEGFAIFLSTMAFDYADTEVREYVQEMRDAFFHYGETGEYADIIPAGWRRGSCIEGFLFYRAVEQHLGLGGLLKSLDRPPKSMELILNPERYLSNNPLARLLP